MKRPLFFAAVMVIGLAVTSHAILGLRDKIDSLWPEKPIQIDGRATEWSEFPVVEVSGLSFRAMNDFSNLYLLIRGANPDGRILLSGNYRQDVTIWFLKPDQKSKAWGITLDFGQAHASAAGGDGGRPPVQEIISLSDMGIVPEMVLPQGLEVSTSTFPPDFAFEADLSSERGRQPIYEIKIPLSMIEHKGRAIFFDVVSSDVSQEVKAELQHQEPAGNAGSENKNSTGGSGGQASSSGRHRRGMGGSSGGGKGASSVEPPKPVHLTLTVHLAKGPKS